MDKDLYIDEENNEENDLTENEVDKFLESGNEGEFDGTVPSLDDEEGFDVSQDALTQVKDSEFDLDEEDEAGEGIEVEKEEDVEVDEEDKGFEDSSDETDTYNIFDEDDVKGYEEINGQEVIMDSMVYDANGNPVETEQEGTIKVDFVEIQDILVPTRGKKFVSDVSGIEESIHRWGLIEPLHVIPYGDKFILLHGYKRYLAMRNMGYEDIPAMINTTRPKELTRYLEAVVNNVQPYNFIEKLEIGQHIEEKQKTFSHDTIENILGLASGDYYRMKYIDYMKDDFDDVYMKVVSGKMTIDLAFKKIEKEVQKMEEAQNNPLNQEKVDDEEMDNYSSVAEEDHVQESGERHPLDPSLRKVVEARDMHSCQACGFGLGEPDLSSVFHVHHIIPVKHKGPDNRNNLVLACPNCHSYVHAFDEGRFSPTREMIEENPEIFNIVLLGNLVKRGLPESYEGTSYDFFYDRARQPWLEEGEEE